MTRSTNAADLGIAELGLGLALELRVAELHRDDRGEALADVVADEVLVLLLQEALAPGVAVHHVGEGLLEALLVHAALGGGDVVGERVEALVVAGVPLERELGLAERLGVAERDDRREQRLLRGVEVRDEVDDAAVVLEHLLGDRVDALVAEHDLEPLIEERHLAQTLQQRLRAEVELLHDRAVGPERDARAVLVGVAEPLERSDRLATVDECHRVAAAVAADLHLEPARQRVDDRHADTVQPAGDLVALAAELAAGVEHREHDLGRGLVGIFGVRVDRDAAAVVDDAAAAVGEQGDVDAVRVARERLVDRVVDDLVDEVMEARRTGGSDVHAGPFADRLKALQNRDVLGRVRHASTPLVRLGRCLVCGPFSVLDNPVPARERPGQRGCIRFRQSTRTVRREPWPEGLGAPRERPAQRGWSRPRVDPATTTRTDVTTPGPQHAAARSTTCRSA